MVCFFVSKQGQQKCPENSQSHLLYEILFPFFINLYFRFFIYSPISVAWRKKKYKGRNKSFMFFITKILLPCTTTKKHQKTSFYQNVSFLFFALRDRVRGNLKLTHSHRAFTMYDGQKRWCRHKMSTHTCDDPSTQSLKLFKLKSASFYIVIDKSSLCM